MNLLREGDAALASAANVGVARDLLAHWPAPSAEQAAVRDRIVAFVDAHPADAHERTCVPGHLTASALVVDATGTRALLTHHAKLGRWLQLGGHCDGDANLVACALREAVEESGIAELAIDPVPIDLDVHTIPARKSDPEHLHLDTRFLVHAPPGAVEVRSHESLALGWFDRAALEALDTDDSVRRLFEFVREA